MLTGVLRKRGYLDRKTDIEGRCCAKIQRWLPASQGRSPSCETVLSVCGTWLQWPEQMNPHPMKGEVLSLPTDKEAEDQRCSMSPSRLPQWLSGKKKPAADVGNMGLIPGSGRSPGVGNATFSHIPAWETPGGLQSTGLQGVRHD